MTYVLPGKPGEICLNGAAARLCQPGDMVIITAFADMTEEELEKFKPTVVIVDEKNGIKTVTNHSGRWDDAI